MGLTVGYSERVGPRREDRFPSLEVARRGFFVGHAVAVDVVVHDRGTSVEAGQRVGRDLLRCDRHVRVLGLRPAPVDGGLDDHWRGGHYRTLFVRQSL